MTDNPLHIPNGHIGTAWVFMADIPESEFDAFKANGIDAATGQIIDTDFIELFDPANLAGYSLSRYLSEANGLHHEQVVADAAKLDAITKPVLIIYSSSLRDGPLDFDPKAPLEFVGRYDNQPTKPVQASITGQHDSEGFGVSAPDTTKKPKSDARIGGMVAMAAIAVMALLVILMVFIAG